MTDKEALKDALTEMVWQFAHRGQHDGKPVLHTGGLSALEGAFDALGWADPLVVEDGPWICDVEGCGGWTVAQGMAWPDTGYWHSCRLHSEACRCGGLKPIMKQRAIAREASRGPDGILQRNKGG